MNKLSSKNMFLRKEIASSVVLFLFGVVFLLYDIKYPMDTWANPGPGVFPLMVGAVLVILAAWQLAQEVRKPKPQGAREKHEGTGRSITEFLQRVRGETKPLLMRFLSLSLSTTPSSVTCPFFTIIRMGLITGMPYFSNPGDP